MGRYNGHHFVTTCSPLKCGDVVVLCCGQVQWTSLCHNMFTFKCGDVVVFCCGQVQWASLCHHIDVLFRYCSPLKCGDVVVLCCGQVQWTSLCHHVNVLCAAWFSGHGSLLSGTHR